MPTNNNAALLERIDALNKAMPEFRKAESNVRSLKAEIAAANIQIHLADPAAKAADISRLLESYLAAW